jgi:hypothetical protein
MKGHEGTSKRKAEDTNRAAQPDAKRQKAALRADDLNASPLSMSPGSPISGKSLSPLRTDSSQKKSKEPSFQMKFKKSNVIKTGIAARLNGGQGSNSEDENFSNEMPSGPTSPRGDGIEESLSPSDSQLAALGSPGQISKLLAKPENAEVTSTTGGSSSRREVLLKQLRDIEAAIARKKKTTT